MRRVALTVLAAVLLPASIALATTVPDRDDVTVGFDIAKVTSSHNRASDQIVTTIDFYEALPHPKTVSGRPPSSVCLEIWTRSTPGESPADYEACATPGKGNAWKGSLARKREKGPQLRIGPIKVEQPIGTRLVLRVKPDDIKRPASYRWRVESWDFGADCKPSAGCPDYAPDRPDTAETELGKAR